MLIEKISRLNWLLLSSLLLSCTAVFSATENSVYGKQENYYEPIVSLYQIGVMHMNGEGVSQDIRQGRYWIHLAARHGYPLAQYNLGAMFFDGIGGEQNKPCAQLWLDKAVKNSEQNDEAHNLSLRALKIMYQEMQTLPKVYKLPTMTECDRLPPFIFNDDQDETEPFVLQTGPSFSQTLRSAAPESHSDTNDVLGVDTLLGEISSQSNGKKTDEENIVDQDVKVSQPDAIPDKTTVSNQNHVDAVTVQEETSEPLPELTKEVSGKDEQNESRELKADNTLENKNDTNAEEKPVMTVIPDVSEESVFNQAQEGDSRPDKEPWVAGQPSSDEVTDGKNVVP